MVIVIVGVVLTWLAWRRIRWLSFDVAGGGGCNEKAILDLVKEGNEDGTVMDMKKTGEN